MLLTIACMLTMSLQGQVMTDSAWRADVKTVQLYPSGSELEAPLLAMGAGGQMVLEFDVLRAEGEDLRWHIAHCDRHWVPDDLEANDFLLGLAEGTMDEYDFSFTTRRDYVHYRTVLPGSFSEFTHSGNYIVSVEDGDGKRLLTRRFRVTEQAVGVRAEVTRPHDGMDIDRRQEVDVVVANGQGMPSSEQWLTVTVQQNGRLDNERELAFSGYSADALTYRYRPQNVFAGGNTYRYFDCSNLSTPMYNVARVEEYGGEQFVLLKPCEDRSRKHYLGEKTLYGGMKVNTQDRQNPRLEAEYVWVNFSLPMAQPLLEGSVYLVGALTDWRLDEGSRMDYNPQYRAYTKRLLLKQGYYSYLLLVSGGPRLASPTVTLEGDHWETGNRYTVYVYSHSPADRADRLLGVGSATP